METMGLAKLLVLAISPVFWILVYPFLDPADFADIGIRNMIAVIIAFFITADSIIPADYLLNRIFYTS
jgi:hypothetical protein